MASKKQRVWRVIQGPSKYDFIEAFSFRKGMPQKVQMRIRETKGVVSEVRDILICAVSKKNDWSDSSPGNEGHLWGFVGSIDWDGTKGTYAIPIVGEYSTQSRTGRVEETSDNLDLLLHETLFRPFPKTQP
ncbi:MAG: hypothetical protein AAB428_01160 [Patescibacteria group bacterium]